jgi:hypothetical protein
VYRAKRVGNSDRGNLQEMYHQDQEKIASYLLQHTYRNLLGECSWSMCYNSQLSVDCTNIEGKKGINTPSSASSKLIKVRAFHANVGQKGRIISRKSVVHMINEKIVNRSWNLHLAENLLA